MPKAIEETAPIIPHHGVILLDDAVVKIRVRGGHLEIESYGWGEHHAARLARVGHNLERLIAASWDGFISLEALRWLAVQKIPLTIVKGSDILLSNPLRPADARMRRAQLMAELSGVSIEISRALIGCKLQEQERVAREKLKDSSAAAAIAGFGKALADARTVEEILIVEARGASAYWIAWKGIEVTFPRKGKREVPAHWRRFGARASLLTNTPKSATNPVNCLLNFLYAILLSESTVALMTMGLDPSLGYLHADLPNRDSLACDLMEAGRPAVDGYVLDLISTPLDRNWFHEKSDGEVCLMPEARKALSQTWRLWSAAVSPAAEMIADMLIPGAPTRLTARRSREAVGRPGMAPLPAVPALQRLCRTCGDPIARNRQYCPSCAPIFQREQIIAAAKDTGWEAAHTPKAEALRGEAQKRHHAERARWDGLPGWLTEEVYIGKIQPLLAHVTTSSIATSLGVSWAYAMRIHRGKARPHARHWVKLAALAGVKPVR